MLQDKKFAEASATVRIPFIRIPSDCPEEQLLYDDLKDLKGDLQEVTDLVNFMLNPQFGIADNIFEVFNCSNPIT